MDEFIKQSLDSIEQHARQIVAEIRGIFGYCNGMETVANRYSCTTHIDNLIQDVSTENTKKEDRNV